MQLTVITEPIIYLFSKQTFSKHPPYIRYAKEFQDFV